MVISVFITLSMWIIRMMIVLLLTMLGILISNIVRYVVGLCLESLHSREILLLTMLGDSFTNMVRVSNLKSYRVSFLTMLDVFLLTWLDISCWIVRICI